VISQVAGEPSRRCRAISTGFREWAPPVWTTVWQPRPFPQPVAAGASSRVCNREPVRACPPMIARADRGRAGLVRVAMPPAEIRRLASRAHAGEPHAISVSRRSYAYITPDRPDRALHRAGRERSAEIIHVPIEAVTPRRDRLTACTSIAAPELHHVAASARVVGAASPGPARESEWHRDRARRGYGSLKATFTPPGHVVRRARAPVIAIETPLRLDLVCRHKARRRRGASHSVQRTQLASVEALVCDVPWCAIQRWRSRRVADVCARCRPTRARVGAAARARTARALVLRELQSCLRHAHPTSPGRRVVAAAALERCALRFRRSRSASLLGLVKALATPRAELREVPTSRRARVPIRVARCVWVSSPHAAAGPRAAGSRSRGALGG